MLKCVVRFLSLILPLVGGLLWLGHPGADARHISVRVQPSKLTSKPIESHPRVALVNAFAQSVFYNTPTVSGPNSTVIQPGTIQQQGVGAIVSNLTYPSGMALDSKGNLYFGNVRFSPVRVNLMKRSADGVVSDLGTVFDSSAGVVGICGWAFDVAVDSLDHVYYNTPTVSGPDGTVIQPGTIQQLGVGAIVSNLTYPSGMAFDSAGNLYFGNVRFGGPVRVNLMMKRSADGVVSDLGTVFDSSAGVSGICGWTFDVAVDSGDHVYYNTTTVSGPNGTVIQPGTIQQLGVGAIVSNLTYPAGMTFDSAGDLYFGNVRFSPVRVNLMKRSADGVVSDLGTVFDSSAGVVGIGGWAFDLAIGAVSNCPLTINPTQDNFPASGGSKTFSVTSPDCAWTASSTDLWISIKTQGDGFVGYAVAANSTASSRTGTITIDGQLFTVTQEAPELELLGLEVTQGIQNLRNDNIPLIKGRPTFVRAYVRSMSGTKLGVAAELVVSRNGQVIETLPSHRSIDVTDVPAFYYLDLFREGLAHSFLFELPPSCWDSAGFLSLEVRGVDPNPFNCGEQNKTCKRTVNLIVSPAPEIVFVPVVWHDGATEYKPGPADYARAVREMERLLPVPVGRINPRIFPIAVETFNDVYPRDLDLPGFRGFLGAQLLRRIEMRRLIHGCVGVSCKQYWVGIIVSPRELGITPLGGSPVPGDSGWANVEDRGDIESSNALAHEVAHLLGRFHTSTVTCGNESDPDLSFPNPIGRISRDLFGESAYYGFDIYTKRIIQPHRGDLMSYCEPTWTSDHTFKQVLKALAARYQILPEASQQGGQALSGTRLAAAPGDPAFLISGTISFADATGQIASLLSIPSPATTPPPVAGAYSVELRNSQGQALASYSFEPDQAVSTTMGTSGYFNLLLPAVINTSKIVLLHGAAELASRTASASLPSVTVIFPNGGESLNGSMATLSWSANDADNDALSYVVQFSKDGGATWNTAVSEWTATTYNLDLSALPGTNQALIRVMVSDGFHTAQDQSNAVFAVGKHHPQSVISAPENNKTYAGNETVSLEGTAFDNEDGQLSGISLTWSSNLNGVLGSGSLLKRNAATLVEGIHTITLTAMDSDNQSDSTSVSIQVFRTLPPQPVTLSIAPSAESFTALAGTGPTAGQPLWIRNTGSGALNWTASANQDWINLSATSGSAPSDLSITVNPMVLAAGHYSGTITVTASGAADSPQQINIQLEVVGSCAHVLSPGVQSFTPLSGAGRFDVSVPSGCSWTATSSENWIFLAPGANSGAGNGAVEYFVSPNTTSSRRAGIVHIGDQAFTVEQGAQFNDVSTSHVFYTEIGKLSARGITLGVGNGNYAPDQPVTREQMAAFIMRALGEFSPPAPTSQRFADVPLTSPLAPFIERLAQLQITLGCGGGYYCASDSVTREQMAAFLIRALGDHNPPPPAAQRFDDVPPSNAFYAFAEELAIRQITLGCSASPPLYCPSQNVTRGQMAAFLVRAFGL